MQTVIPEIAGADSTNNIRFQSESGDSSSVVLTYPTPVLHPGPNPPDPIWMALTT